jgi:hypothetical protein
VAAPATLAQTAPGPDAAPPVKGSLFKDPEDGAFDVGGWIATRTGVLPIPSLITEPAVGFGGALGLVLIHGGGLGGMRDAPPGVTGKPVSPDVSALAGAATENGTWAVFASHTGYWAGDRWRYRGVVGRISPRLDTYDAQGRAYGFNLDGWAIFQELKVRVARSNLFLGGRFVFMDTTTRFSAGLASPDAPAPEFASRESGLGAVAEFDSRDSTFTPSRGVQVKAAATFYGPYLGGDHDYQRYSGDGRFYWDAASRLVLASRLLVQSAAGDAPFYARPFVDLRGIPTMRYQGETAVTLDTEIRWGLTKRWWLVAFAGAGWTDAGSAKALADSSVHSGGFGGRYLVARALGLQAGLDVAKGPEQWAVYVVFGSSW